jgi:glutamyl-tRNA synthetase
MKIRTRIAPSPTGKMHIGTLSTALFDYFLARQSGGSFIIRIEDTDRERLFPGAVENLLTMLQKVGISHDEGPVLNADGTLGEKGNFGPYVQSNRLALYPKYAQELVEKGFAYPCFCSVERLDAMRKAQAAAKQTTKYDRLCLTLTREEAEAKKKEYDAAGKAYVIRLKVPEGKTSFVDAIRGEIEFDHREVDDCILLKSDGFPTYYLACCIDDHLMQISHILRGEEWISSTPKSLILFDMFGWERPTFAHVPLLLGPDKKKLSKRTGDTAIEEYFNHGYLAEALINFVGTLGFNPSADREIFSLEELIQSFDLHKVNKSGAVMNIEKLDWMNRHYMMQLSEDDLASRLPEFVSVDMRDPRMRRAMMIERSRVSRLTEFQDAFALYLALPEYDASLIVWKKSDVHDAIAQLIGVQNMLNHCEVSTFARPELLEAAIKEYITRNGLQNGNVLWPLRVSLSGHEKSATPFELLWALGKEESLLRIEEAIKRLRI